MSKVVSFVLGSHPGEGIKESINNFLVAWGRIGGLGRDVLFSLLNSDVFV